MANLVANHNHCAAMASAIHHQCSALGFPTTAAAATTSAASSGRPSRVSYSTRAQDHKKSTSLADVKHGSWLMALDWRAGMGRGLEDEDHRMVQVVAQAGRSGRSALYGDGETYVLMEPGEDEQFVSAEELQARLKKCLQEWPSEEMPIDLTKFKNVDAAVQFLVNAVCELDLGDGQGSLQWYEVRLDDA